MREQDPRTAELFGDAAIEKLKNSHICIFGVGGVGSYTVEALARAGVGTLTLVDGDCVALSNINRQLIATHSTVGEVKVEVAKRRILDINPEATVHAYNAFVTPESLCEIDFTGVDYIVDAIDTVSTKLALCELAVQRGIRILSSMGTGNKVDASRFRISDISKTSVCPLARVMRIELRKRGIDHLRVLWSDEMPHVASGEKKRVPASCSFVPSVAGLLIAGEVVRDIIK